MILQVRFWRLKKKTQRSNLTSHLRRPNQFKKISKEMAVVRNSRLIVMKRVDLA